MICASVIFAVQRRDYLFRRLRECLGLLGRSETFPESDTGSESPPNGAGISQLQKIIQEIFPQNSFDCVEPEPLESAETAFDHEHFQDETVKQQENLGANPMSYSVFVDEKEELLTRTNEASTHSSVLEDSKDNRFADSKHEGSRSSGLAVLDPVAPVPQQKHEITFEDATFENEARQRTTFDNCPSEQSSLEQEQSNSWAAQEKRSTWIPDILKNGVLTADPSRLLTLLLIVSSLLISSIIYHISFLILFA